MNLNVPDRRWVERAGPAAIEGRITAFIRESVEAASVDGVIVSVSGGLDSSVCAVLAAEALNPDSVIALSMPSESTREENRRDARAIASRTGAEHVEVPIDGLLSSAIGSVEDASPGVEAAHADTRRIARGNLSARLRMALSYFTANATNRLVVGTTNRTELLLGYVTKYGSSACDIRPIGDLYKTEIRELARHLELPEKYLEKPPTAGLWPGQTDREELGAEYETIDAILRSLVDEGKGIDATAESLDRDRALVREFAMTCTSVAHKRSTPPTPGSSG